MRFFRIDDKFPDELIEVHLVPEDFPPPDETEKITDALQIFSLSPGRNPFYELIDLDKRTLIILPGMLARAPKNFRAPRAEENDDGTPGAALPEEDDERIARERLLRTLYRGKRLTQYPPPGEKPCQVIVAAWDSPADNEKRLGELGRDPMGYASGEARHFVSKLSTLLNESKASIDDEDDAFETEMRAKTSGKNVTLLGWSYGTAFMQECANFAQRNKRAYPLPPIYAIGVSSVVDPFASMAQSFPGLQMHGVNDTKLKEIMYGAGADIPTLKIKPGPDWQNRITLHQSYVAKEGALLGKSKKFRDVAEALVLVPDHVVRRKALEGGKWVFDIHDDKTGHAPAAYMDASEDSTCTLDDSTKLDAWAQSAIFQRAADRIIWRDGPLEAKQFLASKAKRKNPPGSPGTGVVNAIIEACLECGRSGNTAGGTK